jgi:hypothetical protein
MVVCLQILPLGELLNPTALEWTAAVENYLQTHIQNGNGNKI